MPTPQRKRILIIDTDADQLVALEHMLEDAGFDTTTTWDIKTAIELIAGARYSLVLIGEHPPEVNREDILKAVWSKSPATQCIVLGPGKGWFELGDRIQPAQPTLSGCTLADVIERINYCLRTTEAAGAA